MANFTELDDHGLNCCNVQQTETDKIMDISLPSETESFYELLYQHSNQLCFSDQFEDFENISHHFNLPASSRKKKEKQEEKPGSKRRKKKNSSCVLEFDEIKKHFGVKITQAAKEMNVGLTLLKRRCRELNIVRWPHRQLKSLKSVIENVKELGLEDEIAKLEKHKSMLERIPGMKLSEETKKLRQYCFKANYNRRRRRKQNTQG
ncbi:protein RKD4-like [Lotus japonicus]|uniref:protein RKD4-like n=1 Tax=Lotus japonicus TaxID=34305 RepID=UPI00258DEDA6|nr:protein RKD4-like [Lotus japonicus]